MRKALTLFAAAMGILSAAAQSPDNASTVTGKKLNFEAPLFGVTAKNARPTWSLVAFGEVNLGFSYALHVPITAGSYGGITASGDKIEVLANPSIGPHPGGICADLSLLELRLRPWRNGNLFFCGLNLGSESHFTSQGALFNKDNIPVWSGAAAELSAKWGTYSERMLSLEIGYVRETGNWSFGIRFLPGIGYSEYRNNYSNMFLPVREDLTLQYGHEYPGHTDIARSLLGFRYAIKADVWYRNFGTFVSVRPVSPSNWSNEYTTVNIGFSIRY